MARMIHRMARGARLPLLMMLSASFLAGCATIPLTSGSSYLTELYRRISYRVDGRYRVVSIFYATDRVVKEGALTVRSFLPKIGEELTYGTVDVKIDPRTTIGQMLPSLYKKMGIIGVQDINRLDEPGFMQRLTDAVAASPHNSLMVVVMGYKDNFEMTAIKAAYSMYHLDINTPVLLFDWPGDQPVSISGYRKAKALATESGPSLGVLLAKIVRETKPQKLWVNSSSLGCQVVCDAFEYMYRHPDLADDEAEIDHVVMAAPDVGEDEFDDQFKKEILALSKRLTTYVSSNDNALLMSGIIDDEKKLGLLQRVNAKEQDQFEEMKDMLYLKSLEPDRFALIDVTPINKASYGHGYYLEAPEFFDDCYLRVIGKHPAANRRVYLLRVQDNVDYWVLR